MRKPVIAGNWKMNKTTAQAVTLSQAISFKRTKDWDDVDVICCPPFTDLKSVYTVLDFDHSDIKLGAQDVFWEEAGAYTGAISPLMLRELECAYCIVGHSERRALFSETDETVNRKVKALITHGISPIVCCGEGLETRDAGETLPFVLKQVEMAFADVDKRAVRDCIVAYEPVWAIGTGRAALPEQAQEVCAAVRALIASKIDRDAADAVRILYGGSMNPANAELFLALDDVDGGLIGTASLNADDFGDLVKAAYLSKR